MAASAKREQCRIGFLTVVEIPERGFVGGLLITNELGRPLEFQCTTPVKANRTQEILYGPTLHEFLYADLIGKTLLERATIRPDIVLAEQSELLGLRPLLDVPLGVLSPGSLPTPTASPTSQATRAEDQALPPIVETRNPMPALSVAAAVGDGERAPAPKTDDARSMGAESERPASADSVSTVRLGRSRLHVAEDQPQDVRRIGEYRQAIPEEADLSEPFERIREALRETLRAA